MKNEVFGLLAKRSQRESIFGKKINRQSLKTTSARLARSGRYELGSKKRANGDARDGAEPLEAHCSVKMDA